MRAAAAIARAVWLVAGVIAGVLVLGIVLTLAQANEDNALVDAALSVGEFFAAPFEDMFELDRRRHQTALNWGIAAAVYLLIGALLAAALRRLAAAAASRGTGPQESDRKRTRGKKD
jgi:hypothetical protein